MKKKPAMFLVFLLAFAFVPLSAQKSTASINGVVTDIYTDFGGFWDSANTAAIPTGDNDLLAFKSDGVIYSTGVNDAALTSRAINFVSTNWEALPVDTLPTSTTGTSYFVAVVKDGATSYPRTIDSSELVSLLTDGTNGLNLGTGITNIPSGTAVTFQIPNGLSASAINDGVPDVLITQIANPNTSLDKLSFKNTNNQIIGSEVSIDQTSITVVTRPGASKAIGFNYFTIPTGTQGSTANADNDLRIKTYDLSNFGITASNFSNVTKLVWTAGGSSDIAFFAYNTSSFSAFNSSASFGTTSTTLNSIADTNLNDGTVTAVATNTATPSATLSVAYSSSTTSVCTVNSSTGVVTLLTAGTCTITASQAATTVNSTSYPASSDTKSFQVLSGSGQSGSGSSSQTASTSVIAEPTTVLPKTGLEDWTLALLSILMVISGLTLIRWVLK